MDVVRSDDLVDVQQVARLVGRTPETVRRWVWSGKLSAVRRGNKLLIERSDLVRIDRRIAPAISLSQWAAQARSVAHGDSGASAADLVLEDRAGRDSGARR